MIEAHTLTILEKYYFGWVFDLISQRSCTGIAFQLECEVVDDLHDLFQEKRTIDFVNGVSPSLIGCSLDSTDKETTSDEETSSTVTHSLAQNDVEEKIKELR